MQPYRMKWVQSSTKRNHVDAEAFLNEFSFVKTSKENHPFYKSQFQQELDIKSNSELSAGNQLSILANKLGYDEKVRLIQEANESLHIATHQLVCDEGGKQFTEEVIAAAERGVQVLFILEGSFWGEFKSGCVNKLKESKVNFIRTHHYLIAKSWTINLHDKLLIADSKHAITGGQNIGSWWSESTGKDKNFRDTDILVKGPVVLSMEKKFINLWLQIKPKSKILDHSIQYIAKLEQEAKKNQKLGLENYESWLNNKTPGLCRFVEQEPFNNNHHVIDTFIELTEKSKNQVILQVPAVHALYFDKARLFREKLLQKAKNENGVVLLTNGPGYFGTNMIASPFSNIHAWFSLNKLYDGTLNTAIKVLVYDYWLHSKIYYFDGLMVAIGSFNYDETAAIWSESTLLCMDDELLQNTKQLLWQDMLNSSILQTPKR